MVSFFYLLKDLIKIIREKLKIPSEKNIIVIHRLPPRKILRAHQLGLTIALMTVLLVICFDYSVLFSNFNCYIAIIVGLLFIIGTLFSGILGLIAGIILLIILLITTSDLKSIWTLLHNLLVWCIYGYASGATLAILYNDLVFLQLYIFKRGAVKIAFAFDVNKEINIIKSPNEREETALLDIIKPFIYFTQKIKLNENIEKNADEVLLLIKKAHDKMSIIDSSFLFERFKELFDLFEEIEISAGDDINENLRELKKLLLERETDKREKAIKYVEDKIEPLVEKYLKLKSRKLYNYQTDYFSEYPYTIAFVANPKILKYQGDAQNDDDYNIDPIIKDLKLFLNAVDNALFSFETNEVLGRPEIWSQIRIVAVFDKELARVEGTDYVLVQPGQMEIDDIVASNLLIPVVEMWERYQKILERKEESRILKMNDSIITDVIFGMSASKDYLRSFAQYALKEIISKNSSSNNNTFQFHLDPKSNKNDEIIRPTIADSDGLIESQHEKFAAIPGMVALNIVGANLKSYIHEFAHAMSSYTYGAICDEYFDKMQFLNYPAVEGTTSLKPFYVNRIERAQQDNGRVIPVHRIFAKYKKSTYYSDREHPSAQENWINYFPDRKTSYAACIMDRNYGAYRFDELISNFMYDRLIVKINR